MKNWKELIKKYSPNSLLRLYRFSKVLRVKVITWIPAYDEDELVTGHHPYFMEDEWFIVCYNQSVKEGLAISDKIRWRAHVICWAAERDRELQGDFVEVGFAKRKKSRFYACPLAMVF